MDYTIFAYRNKTWILYVLSFYRFILPLTETNIVLWINHKSPLRILLANWECLPLPYARALKDNPDISLETREMIHKYAREHNYKPNALALNLRTSRSNTIGVIIPQLVHHFFSCGIEWHRRDSCQSRIQHFGSTKQWEVRARGEDCLLLFRSSSLRSYYFTCQRHGTIRPLSGSYLITIFPLCFTTVSVRVSIPNG